MGGEQGAGPYGQPPAGNPYGQQPPANPYGQQSAGNPYGGSGGSGGPGGPGGPTGPNGPGGFDTNEGGSSKGAIITIVAVAVVALVVIGLGAYFLTRGGDEGSNEAATETSTSEEAGASAESSAPEAESSGDSGAAGAPAEASAVGTPGAQIEISVEADGPVDISAYLPSGNVKEDNVEQPWSKAETEPSPISYNSVLVHPHDYGNSDFTAKCQIKADGKVVAENESSLADGSVKCSYTTEK